MLDPQDIRKHEFTRAWRGYDRDEVHALLDSIAREFEELTRRHQTQAAELKTLRDETVRYQKSEKTLQDAALTLQQAMDEKRRIAEQEATEVLREARARVSEESLAAQARIDAAKAELQRLENERARFYLRFQNLLNDQAALLESLMDEPMPRPEEDGVA